MSVFEGLAPAGDAVLRIEVRDGVIVDVVRRATADADGIPLLLPGLVDVQVNGYAGWDVNADDVSPDTIVEITAALRAVGTTTWVPTVITAPEEKIVRALRAVRDAREKDPRVRDAIPCAHVEGPFISADDGAAGVHDRAWIRPLDADEVERWSQAGPVGIVTVSPHTADAADHIARIVRRGVVVSVGHTSADHRQIRAAVDAGATMATHLGNGIPTMLPRHPNPIWTLLDDDRVTVGLIADGHHLPDETLRAMMRAKGPGRAYLVSDLTALGGLPPGEYETPVGGRVSLSADLRLGHLGSDMLAGAAATLFDGFRRVARMPDVGLHRALEAAAATPARLTPAARPGLASLSPGSPADLLLVEPAELTIQQVIVGGERA
ncbi:N-acetylglucosamine-6-phosphate deacetylase [Microbacterium sp.]|uniref:N-acetylglucosamine-6-phosphate deacetylase n=1 Tax=Microbacterium sp. TaxID=51671 RepID=UPI0037C7FAB1